jgi:peptide methionine sulfoxide reductase MsrA
LGCFWNASFLSNKITNFAGFISGGINGQGLSGAYAQVITNDKPILTICMSGEDMTLAEIQSTLMQLETTLV